MSSVLITGGAGFIGSHFVLRHCEQYPEDTVVVLDALTYAADRTYLDSVAEQIIFVQGDIADTQLISRIVEEHDIESIVNFAAETHVDRSIKDEHPFLHTNIIGTQSLIDVCKAYSNVRLLHVSTDEVYGDVADDDPACTEESPLLPSSPYAASKASGDLLILAAVRTFGIRAAITRCTNNYGPHQALEKFIPTVIRHALRDESVPIYAEGKNKRDWLYVTDHCDAIHAVLQAEQAFNTTHLFNVSADNEQENIVVARMILDILGKPHDLLTFVEDRPGHDWRYAVESSATRALGWKPKVGFEEGLTKTVEWYRGRL